MKLHEIPKGSKIFLSITDGQITTEQMCTFHNLDGMYSVIETEDGGIVHLSRFAPLIKVNDHYELLPDGNE